MKRLRLYLDNCCFNRPFDDQSNLSVYLETQAKLRIQEQIKGNEMELVWSFILTAENEANPDDEVRAKIADWMNLATLYVRYTPDIEAYALVLNKQNGVDAKDALHIACAAKAGCDVLVTTDKKLIRKTRQLEGMLILNPVNFFTDHCGEIRP